MFKFAYDGNHIYEDAVTPAMSTFVLDCSVAVVHNCIE